MRGERRFGEPWRARSWHPTREIGLDETWGGVAQEVRYSVDGIERQVADDAGDRASRRGLERQILDTFGGASSPDCVEILAIFRGPQLGVGFIVATQPRLPCSRFFKCLK